MHQLKIIRNLLPAEIVALASIITLISLHYIYSLTIYYPNSDAIYFIARHYLGPLVPAFVIAMLIWQKKKVNLNFSKLNNNHYAARTILAFSITIFVHFNLKLWSQLINPNNFDHYYQNINDQYPQLLIIIESLGETMRGYLTIFHHPYHEIFVAMFFLSFIVHSINNQKEIFHHLVGSISFVLFFGGISYAFAPANGPFIFFPSDDPLSNGIQNKMLYFYTGFIQSQGNNYSPSFFVAALAAMPSLHLAHSVVFGYFAFMHTRYLGWLYVLPVFYIACEAVASKWHYLVDLPAGILIAVVSIVFAKKFLPEKSLDYCSPTLEKTASANL